MAAHIVANEPAALIEIWQQVANGLTEQIALLDESWTILAVNRAWTKTSALYGAGAFVPGTSYLELIQELADGGLEVARHVVAAIEEIEVGVTDATAFIYTGSPPEAGHVFQLAVNRFEVGGQKLASIVRYDVTRLVELRKLREDYSSSVIAHQAEERQRMARELHDSTMQLMACLSMKIGEARRATDLADLPPILDEVEDLLAKTLQEIRSVSFLAHPPFHSKLTLPEALESLVAGFTHRIGPDVEFQVSGEWHAGCSPAEGAIYRIVQEALSNIHRHSKAAHAKVRLTGNGRMIHAVISDDGVGMPEVINSGVGLGGMRARLADLGGRLAIRSREPAGTAVVASVPVNRVLSTIVR